MPYCRIQIKMKLSMMKKYNFTFWHFEREKFDNYFTIKLKNGILYFLEAINDTLSIKK